ncbi:MAG: peptidoglycan editing factor PgeF [Alphaproteobacteria bacterium]|nr:peptidoglycan editing factor PgeF [Alphaproteobacteria bacterium]
MPVPLTEPALSAQNVVHGFFGRQGGVSTGLFESLNCGFGSDDDPAAVAENRARIAAALGQARAPVLTVHQIHSAEAVRAEAPWAPGAAPRADAIVTDRPRLLIGVLAADCAPVLFADRQAGIIGAAHAGWKGALGGVLESAIAAMERLGADRGRIAAVLGPSISGAAYEVGPEFEARFLADDAANARYFARTSPDARPRFDLQAYVLDRLSAAGLGTVATLARCTYSEPESFFSFRRTTHRGEPDYGRNLSVIGLSGDGA